MDTKVIFSRKPPREHNGYQEDYSSDKVYDGEYSDDDDVFVEDPILDVSSATKPLMHPRQRARVKSRRPDCKCRLLIRPILYFLFLVASLGGLMILILFLVNRYQHRYDFLTQKLIGGKDAETMAVIGCDNIEVEDVWVIGMPKMLTETAFRMVEVNQDGILDVIMGFATGADGYGIPDIVCDIYFNGTKPCFGGLLALDGRTGKELWRHYAPHEIYGVNCNADLNGDGVLDCLGGGRAGTFQAVSGKDGQLLWNFGDQESRNSIMNLYTAQVVADLDHDGVVDVLAAHGGDPLQDPGSEFRLTGRLIFFSGRTGEVLRWVGVPDQRETYYSPQVYTQLDGTQIVLFGTGGETHAGSLWRITLNHLFKGQVQKAVKIYTDEYKGVMTPPVLVDITGDGVQDIIISTFNSSTIAFDGYDYTQLWNYTLPLSESYSTPAAGFYNDDDVPDFLVKFSHGPGFPVYYYSETTVLDGRTGAPLLDQSVRDTVGAQTSSLTISLEGRGNDIFLYWLADCEDHEGGGEEFNFLKGTNVHEQSRSDFCKLRFKTKGFSKVFALSSHVAPPGKTVYYSGDRQRVEHSVWVNTSKEALDFIASHPHLNSHYDKYILKAQGLWQPTDDTVTNDDRMPSLTMPTKEFISPEAHYRNEQTSSRKKGAQIPARQDLNRNRQVPGTRNRGSLGIPNRNGYKDNGKYGNTINGYMSTGDNSPRRNQYDTDYYQLPYDLNTDSQQYPGYYQRNDDDYDDNDRYGQDYPKYKSEKRSQPAEKFHFMREKRDAEMEEKNFMTVEKLKELNEKLLKEIKKREMGYSRYEGQYMRRKKRNSNKMKSPDHGENRKRKRRHVGPHDADGLQRLISTGTVAPSSLPPDHPNYNHTMDFIFATYWFYPAKTHAVLPKDQKCISNKMANEKIRFDPKSEYYGLDHDNYERVITKDCIKESGHELPDDGVYESQDDYNPFSIHMGQMTVYRVRITCTCLNTTMSAPQNQNKRCSQMLPYDHQRWPAYMGRFADSHWMGN
ncbi:uncharacterized protein LOC124125677 isoform X2 [Haliotis rufescens]|uniref:uncharacterized protein LOC124125677 isoform X2 n=1 Tax=Haliotis rufescens TaxID=6454 RepID=UPI00201F2339|nr:uncharacterized protein LOC124125677 isoform X2 [Haliotis rufescens]